MGRTANPETLSSLREQLASTTARLEERSRENQDLRARVLELTEQLAKTAQYAADWLAMSAGKRPMFGVAPQWEPPERPEAEVKEFTPRARAKQHQMMHQFFHDHDVYLRGQEPDGQAASTANSAEQAKSDG